MKEHTTATTEKHGRKTRRGFSFVSAILLGLALALAFGVLAPRLEANPNLSAAPLIFIAGAVAAVLVLRLLVQREHRVALQLVMSQIVGENTSPEIAAMRILEALCVSQGWDAAIKWEVNAEVNRLEFCSAWGSPGRGTGNPHPGEHGAHAWTVAIGPARTCLGRWPPDLDYRPGLPAPQPAHSVRPAPGDGLRLGGACARGQQGSGCSRILLPFPPPRKPREPWRHWRPRPPPWGRCWPAPMSGAGPRNSTASRRSCSTRSPTASAALDRHGLVSFANPAAARLLGTVASDPHRQAGA